MTVKSLLSVLFKIKKPPEPLTYFFLWPKEEETEINFKDLFLDKTINFK